MPLSTLCQRCGLCCDGNLFATVPLRRAEVAPLRRLKLQVLERADGTPELAQRCTALEGRCCTVYAERPEACRRYRCYLLTALAEGEVSLDEAIAVVDGAHERIRAVEAALGPAGADAPPSVMQRARHANLPENGGPLPRPAHDVWEQAKLYLDRHFRGRHGQG
jgi:Fe-S-cluster containining protein